MTDLLVKNGTLVDGTGTPRRIADVAITNGVITAVGSLGSVDATEVIDATGKIVTPGFVDVHTHYDGQATWDELLDPSSGHGVTTIIAGNCGVGFAPVRPGSESWLVQLMEGVEDIPGTALYEGIPWGWESFPDYLDFLDTRRYAIDVGVMVAHGPVRAYVMGGRGARNETATPDDVRQMEQLVRESIEAGAFGVSTSRTIAHKARDGEPVPGTYADEAELWALARAVRDGGGGQLEVAPAGAAGEPSKSLDEVDWMGRVSAEMGIDLSFLMLQNLGMPDMWQHELAALELIRARGANVVAQVAGRPFGMLLGFASYHAFSKRPTYIDLASRLRFDDLVVELRRPKVKAAILAEKDLPLDPSVQFDGLALAIPMFLDRVYTLGASPDYEPEHDRTISSLAAEAGRDPLEYLYDVFCENDGKNFTMFPLLNYANENHDAIREMLVHEGSVSALADGGAHVRMICDASIPTYMLTHWARDRHRGPGIALEEAVKMQTSDTAAFAGLADRGVVAVGKRADLNVIDFAGLRLDHPRPVDDLPAGGRRLLQDAHGYCATIVNGQVTRRDGVDTGARPGRLVRRG